MAKRKQTKRAGRKTQQKQRSASHPGPTHSGKRGEIEIIARGSLLHGSRVLMCRSLKHGYLYLPGGHVEFGESAAAALAREFLEECGEPIRVGELALVSEGTFETKKRRHHEINMVFHVERVGGGDGHTTRQQKARGWAQLSEPPVVESKEDDIAFEWVDLSAVPDFDVRPMAAKAWLATVGSERSRCEWVSEFEA